MKMPWFKIYPEARTDPKLKALTRDQHYVWFQLLCFVAEQPGRGMIANMSDDVLAHAIADGDLELLRSSVRRFVELKLVDLTDEGMTPHGWEKRQKKKDTTNAERQKRHREKVKSKGKSGGEKRNALRNAPVTRYVTLRNAKVTPLLEEREREELNTPPTPKGENGVCVSIQGSEPVPIETLPEAPAPQVDPAELAAVQAKAERLFPLKDFGPKIRATAGDFPLAWIGEALTAMHDGDHADWRYLVGILRRFAKQGGPDSARASPKANGAVSRAEKSKRQTEAYKRILAEMTEDV